MRKFRLAVLLIMMTVALALGGCQSEQLTLDDMPVTVTHNLENGVNLTLPGDWQVLSDTEDCAVFGNADSSISLGISRELAGYSYYSPDELADLAEALLAEELANLQVLEREALNKPDNAVLVTASGDLEDGAAVCQAVVVSPLSAVRYFIVVTANSEAFGEYRQVLRDIYATFELNLTEDELYQKFAEQE